MTTTHNTFANLWLDQIANSAAMPTHNHTKDSFVLFESKFTLNYLQGLLNDLMVDDEEIEQQRLLPIVKFITTRDMYMTRDENGIVEYCLSPATSICTQLAKDLLVYFPGNPALENLTKPKHNLITHVLNLENKENIAAFICCYTDCTSDFIKWVSELPQNEWANFLRMIGYIELARLLVDTEKLTKIKSNAMQLYPNSLDERLNYLDAEVYKLVNTYFNEFAHKSVLSKVQKNSARAQLYCLAYLYKIHRGKDSRYTSPVYSLASSLGASFTGMFYPNKNSEKDRLDLADTYMRFLQSNELLDEWKDTVPNSRLGNIIAAGINMGKDIRRDSSYIPIDNLDRSKCTP